MLGAGDVFWTKWGSQKFRTRSLWIQIGWTRLSAEIKSDLTVGYEIQAVLKLKVYVNKESQAHLCAELMKQAIALDKVEAMGLKPMTGHIWYSVHFHSGLSNKLLVPLRMQSETYVYLWEYSLKTTLVFQLYVKMWKNCEAQRQDMSKVSRLVSGQAG